MYAGSLITKQDWIKELSRNIHFIRVEFDETDMRRGKIDVIITLQYMYWRKHKAEYIQKLREAIYYRVPVAIRLDFKVIGELPLQRFIDTVPCKRIN